MLKQDLYIRTGATAIAASLALLSTPVFAQEAAPVAAPEATTTTAPDATAPQPIVTMDEPASTAPASDSSGTGSLPAVEMTSVKKVTARSAAPAPAKPAAKASTPVAAAAVAAPAVSPGAPAPVAADPLATPAPTTDVAAGAEAQDMPVAQSTAIEPDATEMAFGGALALLVIGGAGLAISRRRRRHENEEVMYEEASEPMVAAEPVAPIAPVKPAPAFTPAYAAPASTRRSAFSWGKPTDIATASAGGSSLSPTEQAMKGPTPDNPSLSLKKRLKRAHFFEMRDAEAARGDSVKVSRFAGLPQKMVDKARQAVPSTSRHDWQLQHA